MFLVKNGIFCYVNVYNNFTTQEIEVLVVNYCTNNSNVKQVVYTLKVKHYLKTNIFTNILMSKIYSKVLFNIYLKIGLFTNGV